MNALPNLLQEQPAKLLVEATMRACEIARRAVTTAADAIVSGQPRLFEAVGRCERELDAIDRDVDEAIVFALSEPNVRDVRELLACMKFVIDLERIGDLVSSFAGRASAIHGRMDQEDLQDFIRMTSVLEQMLTDAQAAFVQRDLNRAIAVLRADSEIDRLRNLIFIRHVENREGSANSESIQVLFMAHALERAGDHAKNLAEEVCHFVSGRTVRHVLRHHDKPYEQLFLDWLRDHQPK